MYAILNFIFFSLIWLFPGIAANDVDITQAVGTSLRSGDASQLSTRFAKNIELVIDTEHVEFSSVQSTHAALILRSFFKKYPPQSFQFIYRGASDKLRYSTGTYVTGGQLFSVYVLMRQNANQQFTINALHFRKE
ncbi:DUF4783 domain-containing protein [Spirosoma sp. BT702]|uniref:DUF4783 domain-containing protein n=1 Tax=Spirosoma profusum TaxID=2771354 RepID=A0A926XZC8_9BACT|nr:DUF4783 domain-containing protein [Spirosoma profusum]MBD2699080.1 DUF4783 domain-containing protein [Spirosoma profusum]